MPRQFEIGGQGEPPKKTAVTKPATPAGTSLLSDRRVQIGAIAAVLVVVFIAVAFGTGMFRGKSPDSSAAADINRADKQAALMAPTGDRDTGNAGAAAPTQSMSTRNSDREAAGSNDNSPPHRDDSGATAPAGGERAGRGNTGD